MHYTVVHEGRIYSWRLSADRKAELEQEARLEATSLSALLRPGHPDWLSHRRNGHSNDDAEQRHFASA